MEALENAETGSEFVATRKVRERFAEALEDTIEFRGEHTLIVRRAKATEVLQFLRDDPELRFDFLADVTCVDYLPRQPRFEVVYHLKSMTHVHRVRVKVRVPEEDPVVETAVGVWPGAEWPEREVFDLFGIQFRNHPDLRRILMPDEWEGHPLRKDFPTGKVEVNFDKTRGK